MKPSLTPGNFAEDERGKVTFNNYFDASAVTRIYFLENRDTDFKRGWQGHKDEQRWFAAVGGSFTVQLIEVDDWETPSRNLKILKFVLSAENFDILHVPKGFVSHIQALEEGSKLMLMSNYKLGEIQDEYRFPENYFNANH